MKVLVAMDGGLKSLVTAWLLKKQGMQVRGVYLDLLGVEKSQPHVEALERKLGISIQVIAAQNEFGSFLAEAKKQALLNGEVLDETLFFHRAYLFPKLLELRKQHQFDRIATGHRVLIQEDQVSKIVRVFRNADEGFADAFYVLGRTQEELALFLLPLGSIPSSMFLKLSRELESGNDTGTPVIWKNELSHANDQPEESGFEVFTPNGAKLGIYRNPQIPPMPGMKFHSTDTPEWTFRFIDVSFLSYQVLAVEERELKIDELYFQEASWFSRADLGLKPLTCGLISKTHQKVTPVRLLQYEGARIKGLLNHTLEAQQANIFKGQTVLWVEGNEILGGGRVLGTR